MIITAHDFGQLIKTTRKKSRMTQVDLAAASGVGERFIRELENGKPTCQLDKALRIAQMLGIRLEARVPHKSE
ncbi:MAG: hypothetical protein A3E84_05010 [Gammaproteobacteria bacterium RIFCSPHIGHO2_12_FULL_42_13]|nr:MAG: hypothetical protein A3E84_05010 [Gammaproteobacteria bacterium RIFCSPHIGHO2_12_FULL_42_13]